jgi:nitrile hydratase accessory protein
VTDRTARTVVAEIDAALAGPTALPRDNGELVFEEPWQGRALGMGVAVMERYAIPRAEFRDRLASAIASRPACPGESVATAYYACWLDAVEAVLSSRID